MIEIKLDLTKIDKAKLFKSEETGRIYLDAVLIETPDNKYGNDYMVVQKQTKEEREAKKESTILGNGKKFEKPEPKSAPVEKDDLPF